MSFDKSRALHVAGVLERCDARDTAALLREAVAENERLHDWGMQKHALVDSLQRDLAAAREELAASRQQLAEVTAKYNEQLPKHEWVAELYRLQDQLSAMTEARDELALIARRAEMYRRDVDRERGVGQRIAELRSVGGNKS